MRSGRPKKKPADVRSEIVRIRFTKRELATIKNAARTGESVSEFCRCSALADAEVEKQWRNIK